MPNQNFTKKQLALVSLYGTKSAESHSLIKTCIQQIQQSPLGNLFQPYDINQIHGTIIGMEKIDGNNTFYNHNIASIKKNKVAMDFDNFLPAIRRNVPMAIQFGGFHPSFEGFTSAGERPYIRTFQIQ